MELLSLIILYFLPTGVAAARKRSDLKLLFISNLLLGWTGIGWLVIIGFALSDAPVAISEGSDPHGLLPHEQQRALAAPNAHFSPEGKRIWQTLELLSGAYEPTLIKRAKEQLKRIEDAAHYADDIIGRKFTKEELSYGRYREAARSVHEASLHYLDMATDLLRSIDMLDHSRANTAEHSEFVAANTRKVENLLDRCHQAIDKLSSFVASLAELNLVEGREAPELASALSELARLSSQARRLNPAEHDLGGDVIK